MEGSDAVEISLVGIRLFRGDFQRNYCRGGVFISSKEQAGVLVVKLKHEKSAGPFGRRYIDIDLLQNEG